MEPLETTDTSAEVQIRSHRRAQWFWCDNDLIDAHAQTIGAIGVALYVALARYANHKTGQCWPSMERLSAQLGMTPLTTRRYLRRLVERGLIAVELRPGHTARITLLDMPAEPARVLRDNGGTEEEGYDVTIPCYDVTPTLLPGNNEPDSSNQRKRTSDKPHNVCDMGAGKAETTSEDILAILQALPLETQESLAETARQSLAAEGMRPCFMIRPVVEERMIALWQDSEYEPAALAPAGT